MDELKDRIEEAQRQVNIRRCAAEKPGATLEDDLALQCARNWLLTLENRELQRRITAQWRAASKQNRAEATRPTRMTPKAAAEALFKKKERV